LPAARGSPSGGRLREGFMLRRLYDWTMAKASHPHAEWWLAFISFIESSFFPIPPHPLLGLMCLAEPQRAIRFAVICTLASVLGGLFGYAIGYFLYEAIGEAILAMLGLTASFPRAACMLREYDVEVILIAGATPVPFKLLTITAGFIEMALVPFVLASLAGRALIFMTVGVLFRLLGAPIKRFIDKYLTLVSTAFVLLVAAGFLGITQVDGGTEEGRDRCAAAAAVAWPRPGRLRCELDVPVEPVAPGFVQVVRREALAVLDQLPAGRADRLDQRLHVRLRRRTAALLHVARRAGGEDVFPSGLAAEPARHDVVESELLRAAAILADEAVAQEHVEARKGRKLARLDVLPQRDDRRDLHVERRRVHFALVSRDHVHPL